MTQRPSFWQHLVSGTGQGVAVAVVGSLVAFSTLIVNVQVQLSELRLKQDQTLQILERSENFADLTPVFSINKILLFCLANEVISLC